MKLLLGIFNPLAFGLPATVPESYQCVGTCGCLLHWRLHCLSYCLLNWLWNFLLTCLLHLDALWKPFGCLFQVFLLPFGSILAPFGRLWRAFLDPGTNPGPISGPGCKKLRNNYNLVEIWLPPGSPI